MSLTGATEATSEGEGICALLAHCLCNSRQVVDVFGYVDPRQEAAAAKPAVTNPEVLSSLASR